MTGTPAKEGELEEVDLGLALALLRTVRGLSQRELAAKARVTSRGALSEYEHGIATPEVKTLRCLLAAMGFPFAALDRTLTYIADLRSEASPDELRREIPASAQIEAFSRRVGQVTTALAREAVSVLLSRGDLPELARPRTPAPSEAAEAITLWEHLRRISPKERRSLVEVSASYRHPGLCKFLSEESEREARRDVKVARELAELALFMAERLMEKELARRFRAFALAHLGNALRVAGDLAAARRAFSQSDALREEAMRPADPTEEAQMLDLKASLYRTDRRFAEALVLLDEARAADREGRRTARILLKKAKVWEEMGEIAAAIDVLREARPFVETERDPVLVYCLRHNLVDYLSKSGRFEEAAGVLPELKALAATAATEIDRIRLRWTEARILAGMGRGDAAAELYQGVRAEFATRELWYDTALVSLELACLYVAEGRTERVKSLAGHLAPAFQAGRMHREAVAALALFRQAADREAVTVELARNVHSYLLRARRDPGLRFER